MPRDLTTAVAANVASARLAPVMFVEALFLSGYLRMWSGYGPKVWNSLTWQGGANSDIDNPVLASLSSISETSDVQAGGVVIGLSAIPSNFIARILAECRQNYPITIWVGTQDLDSGAVTADPTIAFKGRMDVPQLSDSGDTCSMSITVENALIDLQRQRERRYTHEDQQIDHPGDLGFEFVPQLQDSSVVWGAATAKPPSSQNGGPYGPTPNPRGPVMSL